MSWVNSYDFVILTSVLFFLSHRIYMHVWINEQVERLQGNLTNKKKDIITNC